MDEAGIAPKRVRTVHGVAGRAPKFVLLGGVKGGGEGLHWLEPLVLRNADGSFSGEWHQIYDQNTADGEPAAAPGEARSAAEKREERT